MRFYLISDNSDAMNGLRLAGIEGTVARSEADLRAALADAAAQPDIGMILVTEKIADAYTALLDPVRADQSGPLLVTVPSTARGASPATSARLSASRYDKQNHSRYLRL